MNERKKKFQQEKKLQLLLCQNTKLHIYKSKKELVLKITKSYNHVFYAQIEQRMFVFWVNVYLITLPFGGRHCELCLLKLEK